MTGRNKSYSPLGKAKAPETNCADTRNSVWFQLLSTNRSYNSVNGNLAVFTFIISPKEGIRASWATPVVPPNVIQTTSVTEQIRLASVFRRAKVKDLSKCRKVQ